MLILLGAASTIYFTKVTEVGSFSLSTLRYRSDFIFALAISVALLDMTYRIMKKDPILLPRIGFIAILCLLLFLGFSVVSTILAVVTTGLWFDFVGVSNMFHISVGIGLTIVTYFYLRTSESFYRWLFLALFVMPLIPMILSILVVIIPPLDSVPVLSLLFHDSARLTGFTSNPFQLTVSNLVALSFAWVFAMEMWRNKRYKLAIVCLALGFGLAFTIVLSLTRSGFIGIAVVIVAASFLMLRRFRMPIISISIYAIMVPILIGGAWLVLPSYSNEQLTMRLQSDSGRQDVWPYYFQKSVENPQGVGFNFEQIYFLPRISQQDILVRSGDEVEKIRVTHIDKLNQHNEFLGAWMFGGVAAFTLFLLFRWYIFKTITNETASKSGEPGFPVYAGAVSALFGIWAIGIFAGHPFVDVTGCLMSAMVLAGVPKFKSGVFSPITKRTEVKTYERTMGTETAPA